MTENANVPATAAAATAPVVESAIIAAIRAKFNNLVDVKEVKFNFKTITDEKTGLKSKRPTVELTYPVPSFEGLLGVLENPDSAAAKLVLEVMADTVEWRVRELLGEKEDFSQDDLADFKSISWETIANLPKSERRGGGIATEIWEEFAKDYVTVMPAVAGKTVEQVTNASKLFLAKFNPIKTNKPVLTMLKGQLALYTNNSQKAEEFSACIKFLDEKADTLLKKDDADMLKNL